VARSVVAADQRVAVVIMAIVPVVIGIVTRRVMIGVVPRIMVVPAVGVGIDRQRIFLIGRIRRELAGAGIGRALVDIVILGGRLGEVLVGPPAAPATTARTTTGVGRRSVGVGRR